MSSSNTSAIEAEPSTPSEINIEPLSLPLEGEFASYEALFTAAQAHAKNSGYTFVVGKSERRKVV
jgi:hypothetical protein